MISNGLKIALTGPPNSGKSSLFNYIVKKEQSIVTKIPGTTRDIVEKKINYKGYQIVFYDTAGIRETRNIVEREGIKKAKSIARQADLVFYIVDIKEKKQEKSLNSWIIYNKIDKVSKISLKKKTKDNKTFFVSAKTGEGVDTVLHSVYNYIINKTNENNEENYFYTNNRQKNDLEKAVTELELATKEIDEEIIVEHIRSAIYNLERILGKVDIEDVLGSIFSNFCIGK